MEQYCIHAVPDAPEVRLIYIKGMHSVNSWKSEVNLSQCKINLFVEGHSYIIINGKSHVANAGDILLYRVTGKLKWTNNGKEKSPTKYSLLSIMLVNIILERRKGNGEGKNVQRNTSLQANRIYNQEVCSSNRNRQKDSPKVLEYERRRIFKISGREP